MLLKVLLDSTPEKLNEIEFTVKFWKHDTKVACRWEGPGDLEWGKQVGTGTQVCGCRWRRTGEKGYLSMDVATESEVADTKGSTATTVYRDAALIRKKCRHNSLPTDPLSLANQRC